MTSLGSLFSWVRDDPVVFEIATQMLAAQIVLQLLLAAVPSALQQKAGVVAHQLIVFPGCAYATVVGCQMWFGGELAAAQHAGTYVDRIYGQLDGARTLCGFMLGFQIYDLLVTALVPGLRKAEHLLHHTATMLTAASSLALGGPYFQYYAPFFFGVTELSTIPLLIVDIFKQLPDLLESPRGRAVHAGAKSLFVLTFMPIRCLLFPMVMLTKFWPDMLAVYSHADMRFWGGVFAWMLLSSTLLTGLQLWWGYKIVRIVAKGGLEGSKKVK
jgi:hypothetical protein